MLTCLGVPRVFVTTLTTIVAQKIYNIFEQTIVTNIFSAHSAQETMKLTHG